MAGPTSKEIRDHLWSSFLGFKWDNHGTSRISLWQKIEKASALSLEAETTITFLSGSLNNVQRTNAAVIQDLPTPRNAWICNLLGPFCKYSAIQSCALVGGGNVKCVQTAVRKYLKSSCSCFSIFSCVFFKLYSRSLLSVL